MEPVIGAVIGLVVGAVRSGPGGFDASVIVVGSAIGCGLLGALIGGFGPSLLAGTPPDLDVPVLATIGVGGGLGWAIGAAFGWRRARTAPSPGSAQRWILVMAAISIVLFGASIVVAIQSQAFGPSIDEVTRAERDALPLIGGLYCIDVAIATATIIAAAVRGGGGQAVTSPGDPQWQAVVPESL